MIKIFKEEFKHLKETNADLRKFGLTVGIVLLLIAGIVFYFAGRINYYLIIPGGILILAGLIVPGVLKPVNRIWMGFAIMLGIINSRLILSLLFYFILTPIRFIALLSGKRFLNLKLDKNAVTYWEKREKTTIDKIDLERQF